MGYKCKDCFYYTLDSRCRLVDVHRNKNDDKCVAFSHIREHERFFKKGTRDMERVYVKCCICGKLIDRCKPRPNSKCPECQKKEVEEKRRKAKIQHDNEIKRLAYGELADYLIHCTSLDNNLIELGLDEMLNRLSE